MTKAASTEIPGTSHASSPSGMKSGRPGYPHAPRELHVFLQSLPFLNPCSACHWHQAGHGNTAIRQGKDLTTHPITIDKQPTTEHLEFDNARIRQ